MNGFEVRRGLAMLLVCLLIVSLFAGIPGKAKAESASILPNGGFEQVAGGLPQSWSVMSGTVTSSTYTVHGAVYSVQLTDTSAAASVGLRSTKMAVTPGKTYEASVFSYNAQGSSALYLEFWDKNNQLILFPSSSNNSLNTWKQLLISQMAPQEAVYASLRVYAGLANVGVSYFDDAEFQEQVKDPNTPLLNGSMESALNGLPRYWDSIFGGDIALSEVRKRSGAYSVKINDTSATAGIGLRSQKLPVTPGTKYEAEAFAYIESGLATVFLEYWDDANNNVSNVIASGETLNAWKPIRAAGIAPAQAKFATVRLYLGGTNVGVTYYDDASFGEARLDISANLNNGRFESLTNGKPIQWRSVDGSAEVSATPVYEGAHSVKIMNSSSQTAGLRSHLIPVATGQTYKGTVYANTQSGQAEMKLEFWDEDQVLLSSVAQSGGPAEQGWQSINVQTDVPEQAVYASLRLGTAGTAGGTVYYDAAAFTTGGVPNSKTRSTLYSPEKVATARNNVQQLAWAAELKDAAVARADTFLAKGSEFLWNAVPGNSLPRSYAVNQTLGSPITGKDIDRFGNYPYQADPLNRPWKIVDPSSGYTFPTNDFGAYYQSGLDEHGVFKPELADRSLLVNTLYPERGPTWGVDDGFGWVNEQGQRFTFVAYYVHFHAWYKAGAIIQPALDAFRDAYLYTGDIRYARAGTILLDRVADVYPEMDVSKFDQKAFLNSWGKSVGNGKVLGGIWETELVKSFISAYDAFYPAMDDAEIVQFLDAKATLLRLTHEKKSAMDIRRNIEEGILKQVYPAVKKTQILGNDGMHQSALAMAAVVYDTMPETKEWLDFIFQTGSVQSNPTRLTGGNILNSLVADVDRDGNGNESAPGYNALWLQNHRMTADILEGYDLYPQADLYNNVKFRKMFSAMSQLILSEKYTANIGDTGRTGNPFITDRTMENSIKAFEKFGDPFYAQLAYFLNNNSASGIHKDIFAANPNGIAASIQSAVSEHGPLQMKSSIETGYGFAALRDGVNEAAGENTLRDMWMFFGRNKSHGHADALNIGLHAFDLDLAPDLGYPEYSDSKDMHRAQWVVNTVSHNTVVVDMQKQIELGAAAEPKHFDETDFVKLIDVEAPKAYTQTSLYQRTTAMIQADGGNSYAIDLFRISGGNDHTFSFHGADATVTTEGLNVVPQLEGTYAGTTVPYGVRPAGDSVDGPGYTGSGFHYLKNVARDTAPPSQFSVDWNVKDTWNLYGQGSGSPTDVHLRLTMLGQVDDLALADGVPPQNKPGNPTQLRYMLAHRSGTNLESLFTSIIEPYQGERFINLITPLVVKKNGQVVPDNEARAVRVQLTNGRTDYIVNSLNASQAYSVELPGEIYSLAFKGFFGVYSVQSNGQINTYLHDGAYLQRNDEALTSKEGAVTGTVVDFTKVLTPNNEIILDAPGFTGATSDLIGKTLVIANDRIRNGVYQIKAVSVTTNNRLKVDVGDITFVRSYQNANDFSQGFVYDIAEGNAFRIPLTSVSQTNQSELATIELKDSSGSPLSGGAVQYYDGGWKDFGVTNADGRVSKPLPKKSYAFAVVYEGTRNQKTQDTSVTPLVTFQTVKTRVQLKDSQGLPLNSGSVIYYANGWKTFGQISAGEVSKELLSGTYSFGMTVDGTYQQKEQNLAADPAVVFQTVKVAVQLKDSQGNPLDTASVKYYANGWRTLGQTSVGEASKELLPGKYAFGITHEGAYKQKEQNIATDAAVIFQTVKVTVQFKDSQGQFVDGANVKYYANGWLTFGQTSGGEASKELLPGSYTFSLTYGGTTRNQMQDTGTNSVVAFQS